MIRINQANMKKLMTMLEQRTLPKFLPEVILGEREHEVEQLYGTKA